MATVKFQFPGVRGQMGVIADCPNLCLTALMSSLELMSIFVCEGPALMGVARAILLAEVKGTEWELHNWKVRSGVALSYFSLLHHCCCFTICVETTGNLSAVSQTSGSLVCLGTESLNLFLPFTLKYYLE